MVGSAGYVATRTIHQLIDRNINVGGPGTAAAALAACVLPLGQL
jgi:hypothetical protein